MRRLGGVVAGPDRASLVVGVAAAALSGALWFLASADFDIWPLAYVAMVPALWVIDRAATRRRAIFLGWVAGVVANVGGFYWIIELMTRHAAMPWILGALAMVLLCAYQAVVFALLAWAVRRARDGSAARLGRPLLMVVVAPPCMVAFEILVPFIFPWYLAVSQAWVAPMIQIADLTGPVGVSFVLVAINAALYDVVTESRWRRRALSAGVAVALVAATLVYGSTRIRQIDARREAAPALRVGLVQANQALEPAYARPALELLQSMQRVSADLERQGAELLVWPEGSYPYPLSRAAVRDFRQDVEWRIRRGFTVPLVLGAITLEPDRHERETFPRNSAILLDADGAYRGRYDKMHLLMFGEYIPGYETFPFIRKLLPEAASHFARGEGVTTFPLEHRGATYRLGPLICYEDILPAFGRNLARERPHLLVNLTNDTWFGDTAEPWQHLALSVFRAVELRADLVRSVNTGVSAHVDAAGRLRATSYVIDPVVTPADVTGMVVDTALLEAGHTVYARVGDVFGYLCVVAMAALLLWARRRRA